MERMPGHQDIPQEFIEGEATTESESAVSLKSGERVDEVHAQAPDGMDEVQETTDEIEEGPAMTITLPSKAQGQTKDAAAREPLKIRLVKKFLGTPWLPGEPLIYVDGGDRPTEGWTNVHPYIRKCFKDWKMTTPEVVAMTQENPFSIEFIGDDRDSSLRQDSNTSQEPVRHDQKT